MKAPFPYFGGKSKVAGICWDAFGEVKQYIEPFCGSAAMLLSAPKPAALEVVNDANGFIANFWRAVKYQPGEVARWADYPVSHIDLGARHVWLMERMHRLASLHDPEWPGDAQIAGWWLWGQCCWIGSGWCDWFSGKVPHSSSAGMGVQAIGKVPHSSSAGMGGSVYIAASRWLWALSSRLDRVRVVHGAWDRCLNAHYGGSKTAVFLDPPYKGMTGVYGGAADIAPEVEGWAREHGERRRIILCGNFGDYDLPGWRIVQWSRGRSTYSGRKSTDNEALYLSPTCRPTSIEQEVAA